MMQVQGVYTAPETPSLDFITVVLCRRAPVVCCIGSALLFLACDGLKVFWGSGLHVTQTGTGPLRLMVSLAGHSRGEFFLKASHGWHVRLNPRVSMG